MVTYLGSRVVGREENCKQISLACVGSAHSEWTTLSLPQLTAACAFQFYTAQAPGCSAGLLSKVSPAFHVLPRSRLHRFSFGYSIRAQTRLRVHFVPFPGPSSSGNQVLVNTLSQVGHAFNHLPPSQLLHFLSVP